MSNLDLSFLSDLNFIKDLNSQKPTEPPIGLISEFISEHRVMPSGTPFPGAVDLSLTPFAIEWMDNMSPYSPVQHQAIKKAAQVAATFAIECIIAYWMREYPTAILYMSATEKLLEKWATKRLEPMIDSCGIRDKILQNAENTFGKKSRRTGDKTFSKLFIGGFLEMASAQSASSQRSDSIRVLIRDETEGAPKQLTTGEGSWLDTSGARVKFFGPRKKITDLSTPALSKGSYIDEAYNNGDKRLYMVPCPMCGKKQPLYEIPEEGNHGLRADRKGGVIESVYYLCEFCHDAIFDTSKYQMFNGGKWQPTAVSMSNVYRSYYINSLYSPTGTVTWRDYYDQWDKIKTDPDKERGFNNLWAGLSHEETGSRPKIESIHHLRGKYEEGSIPDDVLFLTASVDVQIGKEEYRKMTIEDLELEIADAKKKGKVLPFPRLELEILGHGYGYRTWSIMYKRFEGDIYDSIETGAWGKLTDFYKDLAKDSDIVNDGFRMPSIKRSDGYNFEIPITFIDAGDGNMKDIVYNYTHQFSGFYPSMGVNKLSDIHKRGDVETTHDRARYKIKKVGSDLFAYIIATNHYKKAIYHRSKTGRQSFGQQRPAFMDHPKEYDERYFKMLFAEEHLSDGSFDAKGRPNEALDLKVYNMCAGDVWLDMLVDHWRRVKHDQGHSIQQCKNEIDTVWVLKYLEDITKKQKT
jgi:phage terminase large subunit GpA-like protein